MCGWNIHIRIEQRLPAAIAGMHLRARGELVAKPEGGFVRTPNTDSSYICLLPVNCFAIYIMALCALRITRVARADREGVLSRMGRKVVLFVQRVTVLDFRIELDSLPTTLIHIETKVGGKLATLAYGTIPISLDRYLLLRELRLDRHGSL